MKAVTSKNIIGIVGSAREVFCHARQNVKQEEFIATLKELMDTEE